MRVDGATLAPFISALYASSPDDHQLLGLSAVQFRQRWNQLLLFLGVPHTQGAGPTPAGLRAGGALYFFTELENLELVRWKGRWLSARMLEVYL